MSSSTDEKPKNSLGIPAAIFVVSYIYFLQKILIYQSLIDFDDSIILSTLIKGC